jgi:hypothetical protein
MNHSAEQGASMQKQLIMNSGSGNGVVRATAGSKVVLSGQFFHGTELQRTYSHSELMNGQARFSVVKGQHYSFVISAIFAGKDEAKLLCEINDKSKPMTLNGDDDPPGIDHEIGQYVIIP